MNASRFLPILTVGLALVTGAIVPAATPATTPLSAQRDAWVAHLVVPGDRLEIGYTVETPGVAATATLYVRSNVQRSFRALQMSVHGSSLRTVVPGSLIRDTELRYYAVIRDPQTGRSVQVPAEGARRPDSAWVLERPVVVRLGTHIFGHTRAPEAVVARARPADVGWGEPGNPTGPETFLVGTDRSIWLHDEMNHRLVVWHAARPNTAARSVTLPFLNAEDVAFGPANTLYFDREIPSLRRFFLYRLSLATGKVLWKTELKTGEVGGNTALRVGPDGTLYALAADLGWVPVASPAGQPLSPADQQRRAGYQPLTGGLRLVSDTYAPFAGEGGSHPDPREVRFALIDRAGRLVRAWRVVSRTAINRSGYYTAEPVGGDPVVVLDATAGRDRDFKWEYEVLRLGPSGAKARFSLRHAVFGDNLFADLRVGPDGKLYQLGSSPTTGVTISRYSLA